MTNFYWSIGQVGQGGQVGHDFCRCAHKGKTPRRDLQVLQRVPVGEGPAGRRAQVGRPGRMPQ
jgi:hypothetical protein